MATIVLHGSLAEQFGERFELIIESAGEGLRALFCQVKGFQQAIANGNYFVEINGKESSMATFEQDARERLPRDAEVHICPEAEGGRQMGSNYTWRHHGGCWCLNIMVRRRGIDSEWYRHDCWWCSAIADETTQL